MKWGVSMVAGLRIAIAVRSADRGARDVELSRECCSLIENEGRALPKGSPPLAVDQVVEAGDMVLGRGDEVVEVIERVGQGRGRRPEASSMGRGLEAGDFGFTNNMQIMKLLQRECVVG